MLPAVAADRSFQAKPTLATVAFRHAAAVTAMLNIRRLQTECGRPHSSALTSGTDPDPPVGFLESCPTLGRGFFAFRIYGAAVRDLRQPAESRLTSAQDRSSAMNGFGGRADAAPSTYVDAGFFQAQLSKRQPVSPQALLAVNALLNMASSFLPRSERRILRAASGKEPPNAT